MRKCRVWIGNEFTTSRRSEDSTSKAVISVFALELRHRHRPLGRREIPPSGHPHPRIPLLLRRIGFSTPIPKGSKFVRLVPAARSFDFRPRSRPSPPQNRPFRTPQSLDSPRSSSRSPRFSMLPRSASTAPPIRRAASSGPWSRLHELIREGGPRGMITEGASVRGRGTELGLSISLSRQLFPPIGCWLVGGCGVGVGLGVAIALAIALDRRRRRTLGGVPDRGRDRLRVPDDSLSALGAPG